VWPQVGSALQRVIALALACAGSPANGLANVAHGHNPAALGGCWPGPGAAGGGLLSHCHGTVSVPRSRNGNNGESCAGMPQPRAEADEYQVGLWGELIAYGQRRPASSRSTSACWFPVRLVPNRCRREDCVVLGWMVTIALMVGPSCYRGPGFLLSMEQGTSHRTAWTCLGAGAPAALGLARTAGRAKQV